MKAAAGGLPAEGLRMLQPLLEQHAGMRKEYVALHNRFDLESTQRRQLYNRLMEFQGNIRVFCRCRPMLDREVRESQREQGLSLASAMARCRERLDEGDPGLCGRVRVVVLKRFTKALSLLFCRCVHSLTRGRARMLFAAHHHTMHRPPLPAHPPHRC